MNSDIAPGLKHEVGEIVSDRNTAIALGSGTLPVFGTPRMLALMEAASLGAVSELLEPGYTTVGTKASIEHIAPTVLGGEVMAIALLKETDGRRLVFDVEAYSGDTRIGFGTHERCIINAESFMRKASVTRG